jgi:acyl-coenzyme A synthetase/AMP-(fatty) acid ligase
VGAALPNYQLWIGDHLGLALPPAWTGYIWVSGPGISGGYIGAVNIDDHGFQAHSDTGARCFRNGDRGFINEAGVLFVVSRHLDESVTLVRGHHVELGDISRAIVDKSSGKVAEAAIILYKENEADDQEEPHIQAFVIIAKAPDADSPPYLQAKLRGLDLPAYMRPTRAVLRESLPRTKDGKTDRRAFDGT